MPAQKPKSPGSPRPQRVLRDDSTARVIAKTDFPRTRLSLAQDLARLGVRQNDKLIVHTSMRSLGWVNGGPVAYIQSLMDTVGPEGTIVMPTQSGDNSDPGDWRHPPIPDEWIDEVKRTMPAYDPAVTPTWRMGTVPELFRTMPGVYRSGHPSGSFAAWGRGAEEIVANHGFQRIGEESAVARLYDLDGKVLLVGVGYDRNTSFHLCEYRAKTTTFVPELMPLVFDGKIEWTEVTEIEFMDDESLTSLGQAFEAENDVVFGQVGSAESRLFDVRNCVDFGVRWLDRIHGG
ncbi:MAG: AAC(3) family N-acetyltransferase [Chloroflexi bacterium]|nr:AAC(3) family N-acetyltransferase [Chloroflexota bacterium]